MKRFDVVALGESLVDVINEGADEMGTITLKGNPGGAPANVLAGCAKLGLKTAFIGKLGEDGFGRFLAASMEAAGIDTAGVVFSASHPTTLAIVTLDERGDRSFAFYRNATADVMLEAAEVDGDLLDSCRVFHFGSLSLTAEPARTATLQAARRAKAQGAAISYDPNLRELLWDSLDEAKARMLEGMELADYVKVSEEELRLLSGEEALETGAKRLWERFGMKLLMVTLGPKGCLCCQNGVCYAEKTFDTDCIDTTGAGDAFWGATLSDLLAAEKPVEEFDEARLRELMNFGNAAGSLAATKYGAIPAMPTREAIAECIRTVPRCEG